MPDKKNKSLNPGLRQVKFGDVVQLSKARSQDPLADIWFQRLAPSGFYRYL